MKKIRYYCDKCKFEQEVELFRVTVPVMQLSACTAGKGNYTVSKMNFEPYVIMEEQELCSHCLSLYQALKNESNVRLAQLWKMQQV